MRSSDTGPVSQRVVFREYQEPQPFDDLMTQTHTESDPTVRVADAAPHRSGKRWPVFSFYDDKPG